MNHKKRKIGIILKNTLIILFVIFFAFVIYYQRITHITLPEIHDMQALEIDPVQHNKNTFSINKNWLRKSQSGLWEMYLEGDAFELGVFNGKLTKDLIQKQELAFVDQINKIIPSKFYLKFLKYFTAWFNRDIDDHIPEEYLNEIYGVSFSCSNEFNYISPSYERMLNYHATHDIGHALQDLALVGCTSFAVNMNQENDQLLIGRNFDFYINNEFAENKIIAFVNPAKGYRFTYITWASMIGVVSGMNDQGLTITINAAKSEVPTKSATPISIVAREILQYASNFEEAITIAKKRQVFVSESILIGSAHNNSALVIEKSPSKMGIYNINNDHLVCSNHFQSKTFLNDETNLENIAESASFYREERCNQLISNIDTISYLQTASVLRDRSGINGKDIGIGNEKAMAQMISHHSVIFQPEKLIVWVSTQPWQLGEYVAYELNNIFNLENIPTEDSLLNDTSLTIPEDSFLNSTTFSDYLQYKKWKDAISVHIVDEKRMNNEEAFFNDFVKLNPEYYYTYILSGDYFAEFGQYEKAKMFYEKALTKELETEQNELDLLERLIEVEKELSTNFTN